MRRLEIQGFLGYSETELVSYRFGIRFAYLACLSFVFIGLLLRSIPLLAIMAAIAFLGVVLPRHPFDYLYNNVVRFWVKKPKIPPRTSQVKFACTIATSCLVLIVFLFSLNLSVWAYIVGGLLLAVATLVGTTDICIPSIIYNFLFRKKSFIKQIRESL